MLALARSGVRAGAVRQRWSGGVGDAAQPRQGQVKPRRPRPVGGQVQPVSPGGAGDAAGQGQQATAQGLGHHQLPAGPSPIWVIQRSRLCASVAITSQAALAANFPEG